VTYRPFPTTQAICLPSLRDYSSPTALEALAKKRRIATGFKRDLHYRFLSGVNRDARAFAPIDVFQAVNAGAELVQQTILNPPALLCDRIRNAMECNHRILGHVEAGKSGFQCQVHFLLEKEMRISHAVPHFDKVL
jgi:hypothetical protein